MTRTTTRLAFLLVALCAHTVVAQETVRFANSMALSPDGDTIAISWRGDIWLADATGGPVRRLTTDPGGDTQPSFSPDGKHVAFISNRSGSSQIWVVATEGGSPEQITLNTNGYALSDWTKDGQGFLVRASRDHHWRNSSRHFIQSLDGTKAPEMLFDAYGAEGRLSPSNDHVLFTRERAPVYRKNYHGAQASQVWLYDRKKETFTELHRDHMGSRTPIWGPDGRTYYYCNQSLGAWNVYRASLDNDEMTALTSFKDDGAMFPTISRDGSRIVFLRNFEIWSLDPKSGELAKPSFVYTGDPLVASTARIDHESSTYATMTGDGMEVAFIAGGDVWVMDTELKEPVRVTNTPEEERSLVWSKDFETLYFISDMGGETDIWSARRADPEQYWWQSDRFVLKRMTNDKHPERGLRMHPDGEHLSYYRHASVWMMKSDGTEPREIIDSWNPPSYDFSPDGKWVVYSKEDNNFNDDVWIAALDGSREPFNLSVHPDDDRSPVWSKDGKFIAFTGRRWGTESDIVYVPLAKETDEKTSRQKRLEKALEKMKKRKKGKSNKKPEPTKVQAAKEEAPKGEIHPLAGKWEGISRGGPLPPNGMPFEMNLEIAADGTLTGQAISAMGTLPALGYVYDKKNGDFEITFDNDGVAFLVTGKVTGEQASGTWESGGVSGTWTAKRSEKPSPTVAKSTQKASSSSSSSKSKGKKGGLIDPITIDFDGIHDRMKRVSLSNSFESGLMFGPKGATLYFNGTVGGKRGTYTIDMNGSTTPRASKASFSSGGVWLDDGKSYASNRGGRPNVTTTSGSSTSYSFKAFDERDIGAYHAAIFDQAWRTMRDRWYDENLGPRDWDEIRAKYKPYALATRTTSELGMVSNAMLGELNGSHLGFRMGGGNPLTTSANRADEWRETTGHFGARFDTSFTGPGLKIKDVIEGTPAARKDTNLAAGEIILTVDGKKVDSSMEPATYMNGRSGRVVKLEVLGTDGARRDVEITPTSARAVRGRLYDHWLAFNRKKVAELSNGKFGYVHIRGMGGGNLLTFDEEIYRIGHDKDGLVIDVRENGGGSITDHLLTILCQPTHAITKPRGGGEGYPQDRRIYATWDKPIVVLCNQNSFSNAEIFSHAIKTLNRGRVVGVPTAGGVISTGGAGLMGGAFVRMPFRGWYLMDGEDMELNGCVPNFVIWPRPGEMPAGIDRQLTKAVEVLAEDVKAYQARPRPMLKKAMERTSGN